MTVARLCSNLVLPPAIGVLLLLGTQSVASAQARSVGDSTQPVRGCRGDVTSFEMEGLFMTMTRHPVVTRVLAGSPAALAGLQVGDSVISTNGMDTMAPLSPRPARPRFAPGDTIRLVLQRGTQRVPAFVVLGIRPEGSSDSAPLCVPFAPAR